jgi:hypothetical protein
MNRASQAADKDKQRIEPAQARSRQNLSAQELGVDPWGRRASDLFYHAGGVTENHPPSRLALNRLPRFRRRWGRILLPEKASPPRRGRNFYPGGDLVSGGRHSGGRTLLGQFVPRSRMCPVPPRPCSNCCFLLGFGGTRSAFVNLSHSPRVGSLARDRPPARLSESSTRQRPTDAASVPAF